MKAVIHNNKSSTILHCSGVEKTLISCLLPNTSMSTCYYLLVECRDLPDFTEHTQTPVIITTNRPLPTNILNGTESTEDDGVPIAVGAGVIGAMVVVIIFLVVVLIVVLSQKYKKRVVNSRCIHTVIPMHLNPGVWHNIICTIF